MDVTNPEQPPSPKSSEAHSPQDVKPVIPLRQRQLPASFWQEPTSTRDPNHQHLLLNAGQNQIPTLDPWFHATTMLPNYIPQRLAATVPNIYPHSGSFGPSMWIRNPVSCNCSTCLNYAMSFRVPEVYGLRYNPVLNGTACCPVLNCVDQSCKLCASTAERWHPDRLRQVRLRSARYNAIVD